MIIIIKLTFLFQFDKKKLKLKSSFFKIQLSPKANPNKKVLYDSVLVWQ